MSGYLVLKLHQKNGTKTESRQKLQLSVKVFFNREGQVKEFYHNVRIYTEPSRRLENITREAGRLCNMQNMIEDCKETNISCFTSAMKQILV